MKRKLVCFCEYEFEADIPSNIDLGQEPETEQEILRGEFLNLRCPNCGKLLKPEFPVLIKDPGAEISIFFIPELDRVAYYRNTLSYALGEAQRVVIGYDELVEKFLIKASGLDDRVVEVLKYYLLQKALESYEGDRDVRILFSKTEKDLIFFHAHGIKENEIGVLRVSMEMAEKIAVQLEEKKRQEPFSVILRGPYVSVNKLYTESPE